jgi:hypothetical protein
MVARGRSQPTASWFGTTLIVAFCWSALVLGQGPRVQEPSAAERMQASSPEIEELIRRKGTWSVISTVKLAPDAIPVVTRGLIAEWTMVGRHMQEVMHPPAGEGPDFKRVAGRWQYVSMDMRFPVGVLGASLARPSMLIMAPPLGFGLLLPAALTARLVVCGR